MKLCDISTHHFLPFVVIIGVMFMPWCQKALSAVEIAYIYGDVSADGAIPSGGDPYDQMLLTSTGKTGLSVFKAEVENLGYGIDQYYDQDTTLNSTFLSQFDVIIFGLHQKQWSQVERDALDAWLMAGGGALLYSDSAAGGKYSRVGAQNKVGQTVVNNITAQYGIEVLVDQAAGVTAYRAGPEADHPIVVDQLIFEGEGVSPVAVDPASSARVLIPYTNDATYKVSGSSTVRHKGDLTISNPDYAALATVRVGDGNLVVTFDRQPMWNDGPGSDIERRDNKEILMRVMRFLAGDLSVSEPTPSRKITQVLMQAGAGMSGQAIDFDQGDGGAIVITNDSGAAAVSGLEVDTDTTINFLEDTGG